MKIIIMMFTELTPKYLKKLASAKTGAQLEMRINFI